MTEVSITFLGGVGSFGKNAAIIECDGFRMGIDCGVKFIKDKAHDVEICDLYYLNTVDEFICTHGHEDHIGALPYIEQHKPIIHATPFAQRLIRGKMRHKEPHFKSLGVKTQVGPFVVEALNVQHSIPESTCLIIDSPAGQFVWTGDFRIGANPLLGEATALEAIAERTQKGALALFSDSTGAHIEGMNAGDRVVVEPLAEVFEQTSGSFVVATFASHLERLVAIGKACEMSQRKLFVMGRSLEQNVHRALDCGIVLPALEPIKMFNSTLKEKQVLVVAGTQGEERSTSARISRGDGRFRFGKGDAFVHSARVIPGNREEVGQMFEAFSESGVQVYDGGQNRHVSGHGQRRDLEEMMLHANAKYFCAVHGNHEHLEAHRRVAEELGAPKENVLELKNGDRLFFKNRELVNRDSIEFGDYGIIEGEALPLKTIARLHAKIDP